MHANICGQDFTDGPVIFLRFIGHVFQSIDSAEAQFYPGVSLIVSGPELVDGLGEAVGDLPLLDGLKICPTRIDSDKENRPSDDLSRSRSESKPLLIEQ
jgi:hypothetical protein